MNLWQINIVRKLIMIVWASHTCALSTSRSDTIRRKLCTSLSLSLSLLYTDIIESFFVHTYAFFHLFACHCEERNVRKSRSTRHLDFPRDISLELRKKRNMEGNKATLIPNNHILMTQWLYKWIILEHFRITEER